RMLEAELVELAPRRAQAIAQLILFQLSELVDLHPAPPVVTDSELTNLVLIGSLDAASFIASLATCCVTPPISKRMRPGLTTATQPSGLPLPEPIRVLVVFLAGAFLVVVGFSAFGSAALAFTAGLALAPLVGVAVVALGLVARARLGAGSGEGISIAPRSGSAATSEAGVTGCGGATSI